MEKVFEIALRIAVEAHMDNIQCMVQRLKWRGIDSEVKTYSLEDNIDFENLDIILLGGGSDREQMLVCNRLPNPQSPIPNPQSPLN